MLNRVDLVETYIPKIIVEAASAIADTITSSSDSEYVKNLRKSLLA